MIVLDTHALLWWVSGGEKLSAKARREIRGALARGPLAASAISLLEIATAVRRGRLELAVPAEAWFADLASLPELRIEPVGADIARVAGGFGDEAPGDPADRIIVATALALDADLISADTRLHRLPRPRVLW